MRTVNMAHGSLFLLAAYIAVEVQQRMVGKTRNITSDDVDMWSWAVPLLIGSAIAAVVGFVIFAVFLRWNHGQELRQALITLAISVILADQMLAHAGGLAESMAWPKGVTHFIEIFGQRYATSRLFMLAIALVVGGGAVAVAQPHPHGHRDPRRRRRRADGAGARHQHRHRLRDHVLRRRRSSPAWAA